MALNGYLALKLDNVAVQGGVTQKGRENQILVHSLEWSFEKNAKGEIKWVGEVDKATTDISAGLRDQQRADAIFNFWRPTVTGTEENFFRLTGANGKVTSVDIWLPNTLDPSLTSYPLSVQVTMDFATVTEAYVPDGTSVDIS